VIDSPTEMRASARGIVRRTAAWVLPTGPRALASGRRRKDGNGKPTPHFRVGNEVQGYCRRKPGEEENRVVVEHLKETKAAGKPLPLLLLEGALAVETMEGGPALEDADVLVEGPAIRRVGRNLGATLRGVPCERIDCSGMVLLPGLVNTHHHLFQTLFRAIPAIQDAELFPWLRHLYGYWTRLDEEAATAGALAGIAELLLTGCTTTSDQFYAFPRGLKADLVGAEVRAAEALGIRFHPCRGFLSMGESQGGLPPDALTEDEDAILEDCEAAASRYHDPAPFSMCRVAIGPNAPFTVSEDLFRRSAELGRRLGLRLHTHLAETKDEEKFCRERFGRRPLAYAEDLGWIGPDVWFAHGVHFTGAELRRLAKAGTGVAHCPASNMRLGSGAAPVRAMLDAGVTVGLGVDGSASNDACDVLAEARLAMLLARLTSGVGAMTAREALRMATVGGAALLGRDDVGTLAPGKAADVAGFDVRKVGYAGALRDPVAALVFAGDSHLASLVVGNGRVVVRGGRLLTGDEGEIFERAEAASRRLTGTA
jgi:8-oxoguanine deaminase